MWWMPLRMYLLTSVGGKEMSLVSIVIPVYNEAENLDELLDRTLASPRMIGCAADTNDGEVVGVLLNRNYGQHAAVLAGFAEARGDVVVTLDADLQNPPEEIPKLITALELFRMF